MRPVRYENIILGGIRCERAPQVLRAWFLPSVNMGIIFPFPLIIKPNSICLFCDEGESSWHINLCKIHWKPRIWTQICIFDSQKRRFRCIVYSDGDPQSLARNLLKNSESTPCHQGQYWSYYITGIISIFDIMNILYIICYML